MITAKIKVTQTGKLTKKIMARLKSKTITVGIHQNAGHHPKSGQSYAEIGRAHEKGLGVPRRPWLSQGLLNHKQEIKKVMFQTLIKVIQGKITMKEAAEVTGLKAVSWIKADIADRKYQANAPLTIALKKGDLPLKDTGGFVDRITHAVK